MKERTVLKHPVSSWDWESSLLCQVSDSYSSTGSISGALWNPSSNATVSVSIWFSPIALSCSPLGISLGTATALVIAVVYEDVIWLHANRTPWWFRRSREEGRSVSTSFPDLPLSFVSLMSPCLDAHATSVFNPLAYWHPQFQDQSTVFVLGKQRLDLESCSSISCPILVMLSKQLAKPTTLL